MRLDRLYLKDYQVLRDFEIYFGNQASQILDPSYSLDFLVGVNGTGKSTLLRALSIIFLKLESSAAINDFDFEMEYTLGAPTSANRQRVTLRNLPTESAADSEGVGNAGRRLSCTVTKKNAPDEAIPTEFDNTLLPERIIIFTTGSETSWQKLLVETRSAPEVAPANYLETYKEVMREAAKLELAQAQPPKSEQLSLPEFELAEKEPAKEIDPEESLLRQTLQKLAIEERPGKLLTRSDAEADKPDESRFLFIPGNRLPLVALCGLLADWSKGATESGLAQILKLASIGTIPGFSLKFRLNSANASLPEREKVLKIAKYASRSLQIGNDYLLVFDLKGDETAVAEKLLKDFGGGLKFFEMLLEMSQPLGYNDPILQEVNIFIERATAPTETADTRPAAPVPLLLFDWLSDGERSFLGRMSLFSLLGTTESLIMLDEPEVHFNDYWKRQIVHLLDQSIREHNNHVLIVSHSSITLTDVPRENILVLRRNDYTSVVANPGIATFGANPSDLIVHVFGAKYPMGEYSVEKIKNVLNKTDNIEEVKQLLEITSPGYWSYRLDRKLENMESDTN